MITCSNCGAETPSGQKFCGECGTALAATCGTCGAANPPGQKFCGECGSPLGAAAAAAEAPAVAVERRLEAQADRPAAVDPERSREILLKIEMVAGHGGISGRYQSWRELAFEYAWIVDQITGRD